MLKGIMNSSIALRHVAVALIFSAFITVAAVHNVSAQGNGNPREARFLSTPISVAPGQSIRVGIFNPVFADGSVRTVRGGHVKVFSGSGEVLFEIPFGPIRPGAFQQIDIDRGHLANAGETFSGVQRTRVEMTLTFDGASSAPLGEVFPPSFELVNEVGGQTILIGLLLPAVQKVR